jgi:hypothetical protein
VVLDQPEQKVNKTPISINKLGMMTCTCDPSYTGDIGKKVTFSQAIPGQKAGDSIWKMTKTK